MNYILQEFPNIGFVSASFTDEDLAPIKKEIQTIKNNFENFSKVNKELAGNIVNEYKIIDSRNCVSELILPYIKLHNDNYHYLKDIRFLSEPCPIVLDKCWVNFQKKHEFNPNHNHSGVMSFVIWIDIPYTVDEEKIAGPGKYGNLNVAGQFEFQYINSIGTVSSYIIETDKSYNNKMILFPSKMIHCVYPFYSSNEFRISVSGNFNLKVA